MYSGPTSLARRGSALQLTLCQISQPVLQMDVFVQ